VTDEVDADAEDPPRVEIILARANGEPAAEGIGGERLR